MRGVLAADEELRRVLWYVLGGARGGENRARILLEIRVRPGNPNQLATRLGFDYRTPPPAVHCPPLAATPVQIVEPTLQL